MLDLDRDEFITGVEGYSNHTFVHQLTFVTNKRESTLRAATENLRLTLRWTHLGKWGPHGCPTGEYFQWGDVTADRETEGLCMRMIAVSGRA